MYVLTTDSKTKTQYLKEVNFLLPCYEIGDVIGYTNGRNQLVESSVIQLDLTVVLDNGQSIFMYQYTLSNGDSVPEEDVEYALGE